MVEGIKETDKLHSLFLEVLDDPQKRELLLYLMCYVQVVRREGNLLVELQRYLSCSSKSFRRERHHWKDILVELNLFYIVDAYNNFYMGKDIYKVDEGDINFIGLIDTYARGFEDFSYKVVKYWNIVNKAQVYGGRPSLQNSILMLCLTFNEELYEEALLYSEVCAHRFKHEGLFFDAIKHLSLMELSSDEEKVKHAQASLELLSKLNPVYYQINVKRLLQDISSALRRLNRGKNYQRIKISFVDLNKRHRQGFFRRLWGWVRERLRTLKGGRKWTLDSSETAFCSSTEDYLRRLKRFRIES